MLRPRVLFRLAQIQRVLLRHGLDDLVDRTHLLPAMRWAVTIFRPTVGRHAADRPRGVRIREALIELGPIFVKFGQALSTRRDLLPRDVADELARLQDRVPPFPTSEARSIAEGSYGRPLSEVFADFDDEPLAAASVAQVHGARLADGQDVIVKILRPRVEDTVQRDLDVMYALADLAERYWPEAHRLRPRDVVREFDRTLTDELDLMREAANASQLGRNFHGSPRLYVPGVCWDYCRPRVLVMERIDGIPVNDMVALRERGVDLAKLAAYGVEIFFTQVFRHNFFHADMHPGNIFVDASNPDEPKYMAVDFGIVGSLNPRDQQYLAENFVAFFDRDYHRVARLHLDSGWVPAGTRIDELESAFRTVCEPIFNRPLKDISFGQFLVRLFRAAQRFDMEVQPQLILLQKTLLNIEGLGRELYPDLDLWETAQPILKEWMDERVSGRAVIERLREQLPEVGETLQTLPHVVHGLLQKASEGKLSFDVRVPEVERLRQDLRDERRRRHRLQAGAALLLAGVLWAGLSVTPAWLGYVAALGGAVLVAAARPG